MRTCPLTLAAALALLTGVQVAGAAGEEERKGRLRLSHSGKFSIRMVQDPQGEACRVEVMAHGAPHWTLEKCVGTVDDLFFVSDGGGSFWVLLTVPEKGKAPGRVKGQKRRPRYPGWSFADVAVQYDRAGEVVGRRRLYEFVKTANGLSRVRQLTKHFKWLAGVAGVPGKPPFLDDEGRVVLETVEQKSFKLEFKE